MNLFFVTVTSSFATLKFTEYNKEVEEQLSNTEQHLASSQAQLDITEKKLGAYKELVNVVNNYAGNYPVWKAQQEFRQVMSENNIALKSHDLIVHGGHVSKAQYLDLYLTRVVDSFAQAVNINVIDYEGEKGFWSGHVIALTST